MRPSVSQSVSRRQLLAASAGAALTVPVFGKALAQETVDLGFFGPTSAAEIEAHFQPTWEAFTQQHPGITVKGDGVPFVDYQNTLVQRFSSGNPGFDVFYVDPTYIPTFAESGYLLDLTDSFGAEAEKVFSPTNVEGSRYQGRMLTMPIWDSTQVLYFNRALLKQAGIEDPSSNPDQRLTWEQLIELGKQAQGAGAEFGFAFEQVDRYYQLQPLPESLGGGPGVTGDDLLTVDITNDAWRTAGEWYASIYRDGIAPKDLANSAETGGAFEAGQLAFFVAGPWQVAAFNEAKETAGLDFGFAPHPYFDGGKPVTPSESWHWGISSASTHQEEALELLRFGGLSGEGNSLTSGGMFLVTNVEANTELLAGQEKADPSLKGWQTLLSYELANTAIRRPRTLGYLQLEELVSRAWADLRQGLDVGETLERTQGELEAVFERIGR